MEITLRKSAARTKCSIILYVGDCHYVVLCIIFSRVKITQVNHFLILSKLPAQSVARSIYSLVRSIKNGLKILNKNLLFQLGSLVYSQTTQTELNIAVLLINTYL